MNSEGARALASVAAHLMLLAVLAAVALLFADAHLPPQDLPWKPLRLNDPIGLATRVKLLRAEAEPGLCRAVLASGGVAFRSLPDRRSGYCHVTSSLVLIRPQPALAPAAPVMSCGETLAYLMWVRHVAEPEAHRALGSNLTAVRHYGSYACRRIAGGGGDVSQHAYANALDVAAFELADGRSVSVAGSWKSAGPQAHFLRGVRDGACGLFHGVLSPDYNAAHADHLHLDMGPYMICR